MISVSVTCNCQVTVACHWHTNHAPKTLQNYCPFNLFTTQIWSQWCNNTMLNFLCHLDKENHNFHWWYVCSVCQWVLLPDPCNRHMVGDGGGRPWWQMKYSLLIHFNTHQINYRLNVSDLWIVYDTKKSLYTIKSLQMFAFEN